MGDVQFSIGGKVIGQMQSFEYEPELPKSEFKSLKWGASIAMQNATVDMDAIRKALGLPEPGFSPTFDMTVDGYKKIRPFPNGRKTLPKKKRHRNKWLKKYHSRTKAIYFGCRVVGEKLTSVELIATHARPLP